MSKANPTIIPTTAPTEIMSLLLMIVKKILEVGAIVGAGDGGVLRIMVIIGSVNRGSDEAVTLYSALLRYFLAFN